MNKQFFHKRLIIGIVLFILLIFFSFISLSIGEFCVSLNALIKGEINEKLKFIILNLRLTRTIGAIIAGAAIGVSGCVLQNILRNPLASPFTLGVTQGAAFGATFAIISLNSIAGLQYTIIASAFAGSIIAILCILIISFFSEASSEAIILAGVGIGAFFNAGIMFLKYFATDIQVASAVFWTFGDLSKADWNNILIMSIFVLIGLIIFIMNSWNYNAYLWGRDTAKSLGVNTKMLTILTLSISSLISSVVTAFLGIIGFIGLIAPHIVRMIIGNDYRYLIPLSAINGALILLVCDIIARTILKPVVLPVGIITSFAGVPLFLYILIHLKRK